MSNESNNIEQLQKYVVRTIVEYFAKESETVTSRYVLYFDSLENIVTFENVIQKLLSVDYERKDMLARIGGDASLSVSLLDPYEFRNEDGGLEYSAIQIKIQTEMMCRSIVFIPDCDENGELLGDAFKNGIRNQFVDEHQEGILFYLSVQNIASVSKTTENFQRQGMPLSVNNVYENLKSRVSIIQGVNQRATVLYALNIIKDNKPKSDTSLLDFAPIIRIIESKILGADDFHDLHMFSMSLTDLGKNNCMLAENHRLFRDISLALSDQELETVMSSYDDRVIQEIKKAYEKNEDEWDKDISFEYIKKHKKATQKKFKSEKIEIIDSEGNALDHKFYLDFYKNTYASFIILTRNYPGNKEFSIIIHFTQKAKVSSDAFSVEPVDAKGKVHKIVIDGSAYNTNGAVVFEGTKGEKFSVVASAICVTQNFFADTCIGFTKSHSSFVYQLKASDYMVSLGDGVDKIDLPIEFTPNIAPILVNTNYRTDIKFSFPEGESAKEHAVKLNLDDNSALIDASIKFEGSQNAHIELFEIFNRCMLLGDSFFLDNGVLINKHKHSEKYTPEEFDVAGKKYKLSALLKLEKDIVENKYIYIRTNGLNFAEEYKCNAPLDVLTCYYKICEYFIDAGTTPSISAISSDLIELYKGYIAAILKYIDENSTGFIDKENLPSEIFHIFKLGVVEDNDGLIWLTPLNPLSVSYQLELNNTNIIWTKFDKHLYESLGYGNSLPFIMNENDTIFQSIKGSYPVQWSCYCDASQSIKGDSNTYFQKIEDYYSKFVYLFAGSNNKTFIINVIGIQHTSEIIQAILKLFKSRKIDVSEFYLDINYYFKETGKNEFENMTEYEYVYSVASRYYSSRDLDTISDFCDWYVDHVKYNAIKDTGEYKYAHISFCALQNEKKSSLSNTVSRSKSGMMLNGLINDIPSSLDKESGIYKYGFGAQYMEELKSSSQFIELACSYNELAKCKEGSPASRDISIAQGVQNTKSDVLDSIYKASNWVVFVEPKIDLDFFIEQDNEKEDDLIIIHYPDKNVTSAGYTSITVTQKSNQYINVIKEYLQEKIPFDSEIVDIKNIIKDFNAYSGEWLMNFINGKQVEEKISLVSAIGFCRNYFSLVYPEYTWVPIALDEVLRVTGSIGGTLTDVLFSKKVLINRGIIESQNATSDDLMFAGIKVVGDELHVTYIPVEVKHGNCDSKTRADAHNQVCNTAQLIRSSFVDQDKEKGCRIDKKIYRNYMIQHIISNAEKMLAYRLADEDDYTSIVDSQIRVNLLNDNYILDINQNTDLYSFYFVEGQVAVSKTHNSNDSVTEISVPIANMYKYLFDNDLISNDARALSEITTEVDGTNYEISIPDEEFDYSDDADEGDKVSEKLSNELAELEIQSETIMNQTDLNSGVTNSEPQEIIESSDINDKEKGARVLIGKDKANNKIYWEFGNKQLSNRHILITGKSGNGKTYCIQAMLFELSKSNISSVIFDYTEGFTEARLESLFKEKMGNKIHQYLFYSDGVPINPFKRHEIDLAGNKILEKNADVASRLAEVFSRVYDFGPQQSSAIFDAVLSGIEKYGDGMNMRHFKDVLDELSESNKNVKTVISKMTPFFYTVEFKNSSDFDWGDILYSDEPQVNIMQLTGFTRDLQKLITELLLWDAWYYAQKYGNQDKPFVMVLDEAQNLSHNEKSPNAKILTEGRKFGWSAWFATQSLELLKDDEVIRLSQAAMKLFFKPTDEEVPKIAKLIDPTGKTNWIPTVYDLQKGTCIVVGSRTNSAGEFVSSLPTVVSVSSFEDRK